MSACTRSRPGTTRSRKSPSIAASTGKIVGAALGNDVNLRDVEGRSALLLGKAKDNNASAALGPFIRLFDGSFSIDDVKKARVRLKVEGEDGFSLEGASSMAEISRSPEELVAAAMGPHHQYPDGMALYLGTMFVPSKDRGEKGKGFTHKVGDIVTISSEKLGALVNRGVCRPTALPGPMGRAISCATSPGPISSEAGMDKTNVQFDEHGRRMVRQRQARPVVQTFGRLPRRHQHPSGREA